MYVIVFLLPKSCSLERVAYWFCETEKLTFILGYYSYATGAHAKQKNSFFLQQQPKAFVGGNQFSCRLSKAGFSFCIFLFAWEKSRARRFGGVCVCKNSSQVALFSAHFFFGFNISVASRLVSFPLESISFINYWKYRYRMRCQSDPQMTTKAHRNTKLISFAINSAN